MERNNDTLIHSYIESNNFGRLLGMEFKILEPGKVEYFVRVKNEHLATPNSAHGGFIAAFMDGLLGICGLSCVHQDFKVVSTIEFKINFFNPVYFGDSLVGRASVLHKGKRILVVEGEIFSINRNDMPVAKSIGTFNSYSAEKAGYKLK